MMRRGARMWRILVVILLIGFLPSWMLNISYADDAKVLPKGVTRIGMETDFYFPVTKRYGSDGQVEDLAVDYNTSLDSTVFPALQPLDPFVGGLASVGDSIVDFKIYITNPNFYIQHGITDNLSVGVYIPYWIERNVVHAQVNSTPGSSSANVGKNPGFACGAPLCPLSVPGTVPLTTNDVQDLLGGGLDVNGDGTADVPGFGYENVKNWSDAGIGDIEAGFRYRYLNTKSWRLAFTGGVRFPTGRVDNPDILTDDWFGQGAYALLFRSNNDYTGINNLILNTTFRYDLVLPDTQTKRVPIDVNFPVTANKEVVNRNLGDEMQFEISGKYEFLKGLSTHLLYNYRYKMEDFVSGSKGYNYHSLEQETRVTQQIYIVGLSYSTLPLFSEKKFPVPLITTISYRNKFAGTNNTFKSQYIGFEFEVYF